MLARMTRLAALTLITAAAIGLTACSAADSAGVSEAALACDHFRNIAGDASAGILTDSELREKLQEVYEGSVIAPDDVRSAARELLAALTTGTSDEFATAVTEMGAACERAGH